MIHCRKARFIIPAFVISLLFLLVGCESSNETTPPTLPTGIDIPFETMYYDKFAHYEQSSPQIRVVITKNVQFQLSDYIDTEAKAAIQNVDFSEYFVIVALQGYGVVFERDIDIQRIWQNDNFVYVQAYFGVPDPEDTTGPMTTSPYHMVKVNKEALPQSGKLTFELLDHTGNERATTTQTISIE